METNNLLIYFSAGLFIISFIMFFSFVRKFLKPRKSSQYFLRIVPFLIIVPLIMGSHIYEKDFKKNNGWVIYRKDKSTQTISLLRDSIMQLENKVNNLNFERQNLITDIKGKKIEINNLSQKLAESSAESQRLLYDIGIKNQNIISLRTEIVSIENFHLNQNEVYDSEIIQLKTTIEELNQKVALLEKENEDLKKAIEFKSIISDNEKQQTVEFKKNSPIRKPNLWAFVIGSDIPTKSDNYYQPCESIVDALSLYKSLDRLKINNTSINIEILTGDELDDENVDSLMSNLFNKANKEDIIMLFVSGLSSENGFYLNERKILYHREIKKALNKSQAKNKLVIANIYEYVALSSKLKNRTKVSTAEFFNTFTKENIPVLTASMYTKNTECYKEGNTSIFASALIDALQGQADTNKDKTVTFDEAYRYIYREVKTFTGDEQSPVLAGNNTAVKEKPLIVLK